MILSHKNWAVAHLIQAKLEKSLSALRSKKMSAEDYLEYLDGLDLTKKVWWIQSGSNRRPHPCKGCALPAELWPHSGMRRLTKTNY